MTEGSFSDPRPPTHGIYQWQVHRWLNYAKEQGFLTERTIHQFRPHGLTDERLGLVRDVSTWHELLSRLRRIRAPNHVCVRSARVFVSGQGSTELRQRKFGMQAAGVLPELLKRSSTFAVAWGTTIAHVIDALGVRGLEPSERRIEFVPVRAEEL